MQNWQYTESYRTILELWEPRKYRISLALSPCPGMRRVRPKPIRPSRSPSRMVKGLSLGDQRDLIPHCRGRNIPLRYYIKDICNTGIFVPAGKKVEFAAAIIAK